MPYGYAEGADVVASSVPTTNQGAMVTVQDPATGSARSMRWNGLRYVDVGDLRFYLGRMCSGILGSPVGLYSGTYTFTEQHPVPKNAVGFRVRWRNYAASAMALAIAKYAVAPASGNNGTGLTWRILTVAGAGTANVPAAIGSGASIQPGILYSDPVYGIVQSPYIQTRSVFGSGGARTCTAADLNALNSDMGVNILSVATAGDHATTIDSQTPSTGSPSYHTCDIEWILEPLLPTCSLIDVGDSRSRGEYSTSGRLGPSVWAQKLAAVNGRFLLGSSNYGVSGAPRAASHAELLKILSIDLPTYATVWFESPNDGSGQAAMDADFAMGVYAVTECQKNRVIPIICTPTPRNATSGALTVWTAQRDRIRNFAAQNNLMCADYASVLEDSANPGQWISAMKASGDGTNFHPSQEGYKAMGTVLYAAISAQNA